MSPLKSRIGRERRTRCASFIQAGTVQSTTEEGNQPLTGAITAHCKPPLVLFTQAPAARRSMIDRPALSRRGRPLSSALYRLFPSSEGLSEGPHSRDLNSSIVQPTSGCRMYLPHEICSSFPGAGLNETFVSYDTWSVFPRTIRCDIVCLLPNSHCGNCHNDLPAIGQQLSHVNPILHRPIPMATKGPFTRLALVHYR
jgi:hypothetical protein